MPMKLIGLGRPEGFRISERKGLNFVLDARRHSRTGTVAIMADIENEVLDVFAGKVDASRLQPSHGMRSAVDCSSIASDLELVTPSFRAKGICGWLPTG